MIYSDIMKEFGIDVKPGPMYKAEVTGFNLKNKTPLIVSGKGGSLLVLSVVIMLTGAGLSGATGIYISSFATLRMLDLQEYTNVICKRFL
jgi:hypothetical protein